MKISPFLFLAIFCFLIIPASAIEISTPPCYQVAHFVAPAGYLGDTDSLIIVSQGTDTRVYDTTGGSISLGVLSFPNTVAGIYSTKEWNYYILQDGRAYKIKNTNSQLNYTTLQFSGDSRNAYYLGDFSASTNALNCKILADQNGDIFIYDSGGAVIYKMDGATYTYVTYMSYDVLHSLFTATGRSSLGISFSDNALLLSGAYSTSQIKVVSVTGADTYTTLKDGISSGYNTAAMRAPFFAALSNGNYIIGATDYNTVKSIKVYEYNSTFSQIGTIVETASYYGGSPSNLGNLIVKPNGILVLTSTATAKTVTYTSISEAGGIYFEESGTSPSEISYNSKTVNAEYETYYNQTTVNFRWALAIDDDFIDTYNSAYSEPIYNRYYWRIDLFSPNGIFVNSYIIPSNWKYQSYTLGIFGSGDYINAGNVGFNNIVGNGTYTVKLYEINSITGAKAFLDADTFEILDQTNPYSNGGITESSGESAAYKFLNSPYLVAIIVIGVVGFQFGRGRDGNINGTAMIVLVPLAVGLCCLMGILPMWILYVMVLCIIAFIAVKMSTGGS